MGILLLPLLGSRREHTPLPERISYKCYYTTGKRAKIPRNLGFLPGPRRIQQPGHCWSELTFQSATGRPIRALPSAFSLHHIKPTRLRAALLSNNRPLFTQKSWQREDFKRDFEIFSLKNTQPTWNANLFIDRSYTIKKKNGYRSLVQTKLDLGFCFVFRSRTLERVFGEPNNLETIWNNERFRAFGRDEDEENMEMERLVGV
jgi:hypothetical protein